jgi:salicylate 5-hydroxylase small subunit
VSTAAPAIVRDALQDLYADYASILDDGPIEEWPGLFTEDCHYAIVARENHDRGLPLALMRCESRAMLQDRLNAVLQLSVYAPRSLRHVIGPLRIRPRDDGSFDVVAAYAVFRTSIDAPSEVFNVGRYVDHVVLTAEGPRFASKLCVYDSVLVPNSLIVPL